MRLKIKSCGGWVCYIGLSLKMVESKGSSRPVGTISSCSGLSVGHFSLGLLLGLFLIFVASSSLCDNSLSIDSLAVFQPYSDRSARRIWFCLGTINLMPSSNFARHATCLLACMAFGYGLLNLFVVLEPLLVPLFLEWPRLGKFHTLNLTNLTNLTVRHVRTQKCSRTLVSWCPACCPLHFSPSNMFASSRFLPVLSNP